MHACYMDTSGTRAQAHTKSQALDPCFYKVLEGFVKSLARKPLLSQRFVKSRAPRPFSYKVNFVAPYFCKVNYRTCLHINPTNN